MGVREDVEASYKNFSAAMTRDKTNLEVVSIHEMMMMPESGGQPVRGFNGKYRYLVGGAPMALELFLFQSSEMVNRFEVTSSASIADKLSKRVGPLLGNLAPQIAR